MQIKGFPPSININDAAAVFNTLANKQLIFTIYQFKLPEHLQPLGFVHLKLFHLSLPAYCEYFRDSYLSRRQNIMANDLAKSTAPWPPFSCHLRWPRAILKVITFLIAQIVFMLKHLENIKRNICLFILFKKSGWICSLMK